VQETFIVSARKYRPENWESVVGQGAITSTLNNAIQTGQIAQAYLFCGPRGVGKTTCARIFAREINRKYTDNPDQDFSFNIFELDAASNNKAEDIRAITDQVRIPPHIGKYKVYIIDEVHMLTQSAFNAFLKTLEEPPAHTVFILATTERHKIIPTILSRCQIFDFRRITVDDMSEHLVRIAEKENIKADREALHIIAQKADGALRDALSIFDQLSAFTGRDLTYAKVLDNLNVLDYEYFFRITDAVIGGKVKDCLLIFDEILQKGFDGSHFIAGLGEHFRNLLVAKDPETIKLLDVSSNVGDKYKLQAAMLDIFVLIQGLDVIADTDTRYSQSKNQRLSVELMLMKLAALGVGAAEKKKPELKLLPIDGFSSEPVAAPVIVAMPPSTPLASKPAERLQKPIHGTASMPFRAEERFSLTKMLEENDISLSEVEVDSQVSGSEVFTQSQLEEVWSNFAERIKEDKGQNLYVLLTGTRPQLLDGYEVKFTLINSAQQLALEAIIPELMGFLRSQLRNGAISLKTQIDQSASLQVQSHVHIGGEALFEEMAAKNPAIRSLRTFLRLEPEE
jgi:DNA polymerase-3 subunit gamma/tau